MKIGRNAPCPCGSGKKYKLCHQKAEAEGKGDWSKNALYVIAALLILGAGGFVYGIFAAPEDGRIWSAEHGHWHNADGSELRADGGRVFVPQPPGEAPAGQVWSSEHGHWHNTDGSEVGGGSTNIVPQPAGDAPAGQVWSEEHGHWHDAETGLAVGQ